MASSGITLNKVLAADTAGPLFHKAHEYSCYALAAATPLAALSGKDSPLTKLSDLALAFAIPVHMHYGMNACVTDYLPKAARGPARYAVLGVAGLTCLGLLKTNLTGPGITGMVKGLWCKPEKK